MTQKAPGKAHRGGTSLVEIMRKSNDAAAEAYFVEQCWPTAILRDDGGRSARTAQARHTGVGAPGGLGQRPSPGLQRPLNSGESAKRRVTMSDSASPCVRRPRLPVRCKRSADAQMKGAVRADHSARSISCEARRDSPLPPCRKLPHPPGHRRAFAAPLSTKPRPWRTSSAHCEVPYENVLGEEGRGGPGADVRPRLRTRGARGRSARHHGRVHGRGDALRARAPAVRPAPRRVPARAGQGCRHVLDDERVPRLRLRGRRRLRPRRDHAQGGAPVARIPRDSLATFTPKFEILVPESDLGV